MTLCFIFSGHCFAGNKSSKYLLSHVESDIKQIQKIISEVKSYMNGIEETGSFVKNDFWGTTPAFYFDKSSLGVTSLYFLNDQVANNLNYEYTNTNFIRTISNIELHPTVLDKWIIPLYFNYDALLPSEGNRFTDSGLLGDYFIDHGVPFNRVDDALAEYTQYYDKVATLALEGIVGNIDRLYRGIYQNQSISRTKTFVQLYNKNKAGGRKKSLQRRKNKALQVNSLHEALNLRSKDDFLQKIAQGDLNRLNTLSVMVAMYRYEFKIGSSNEPQSRKLQIVEFEHLLKNKVAQGKAKVSSLKRHGYPSKYIAYTDIVGSVKYPATVFFDKETGEGIWQIGYWNSKNQLKKINDKLIRANEQLQISFQGYLEIKREEILSKYGSKEIAKHFNGEF